MVVYSGPILNENRMHRPWPQLARDYLLRDFLASVDTTPKNGFWIAIQIPIIFVVETHLLWNGIDLAKFIWPKCYHMSCLFIRWLVLPLCLFLHPLALPFSLIHHPPRSVCLSSCLVCLFVSPSVFSLWLFVHQLVKGLLKSKNTWGFISRYCCKIHDSAGCLC